MAVAELEQTASGMILSRLPVNAETRHEPLYLSAGLAQLSGHRGDVAALHPEELDQLIPELQVLA